MNLSFGKAQVSVRGEGCMRCGTLWSSHWYPLKEVPVKVGSREGCITLNVCHDCATPEERGTAQVTLC